MYAVYVTVKAVGKDSSVPVDAISGFDIFIYTVNTQNFVTENAKLFPTMADQHVKTVILPAFTYSCLSFLSIACSNRIFNMLVLVVGDKADIPGLIVVIYVLGHGVPSMLPPSRSSVRLACLSHSSC